METLVRDVESLGLKVEDVYWTGKVKEIYIQNDRRCNGSAAFVCKKCHGETPPSLIAWWWMERSTTLSIVSTIWAIC